ncbi:peptidoglycan-binding domain-containing protein [Leptothoe sp. PORK10 BA2]|uniref:peptidoglycan-binding domain-containing protein n=1 Tax=Leptothoe sp. PORK10 BA2 TaxID=3110254 RepID=UPI002B1F8B84|nr:peptidoglycan-binding domain-containing protein [Leptothoe sp. PORK10 BA2]MEA5465386.1 peptidoglycan-binding domain-containing protein [Leptothoe sp. PORK10 BA2]
MPKLLTAAVVGGILTFWGAAVHAQSELLPAPPPPSLPSPSGFVGPASAGRSLGPGDVGRDVEALQLALDRNGIDPGPIDGAYGPMTRSAVQQFQQWYDLPVTGVAGPETLDILGVVPAGSNDINYAALGSEDFSNDNFPYVAAVTESLDDLGEVQRSFGNAAIDSSRQGRFINIGSYSTRSAAAERVREARRLGFDARTLYQR